MLNEFKVFIAKGNVLDMAVGVIMGTAFGAIVKSLVDDVIMPPIGKLTGGVDFSDLFLALDGQDYTNLAAAKAAGAATVNYGVFINSVITFMIIAFVIFLIVKNVNKLIKKQAEAPAGPTPDQALLTEIRDLLAKR
jgi:large conductance mechanosensitive channel